MVPGLKLPTGFHGHLLPKELTQPPLWPDGLAKLLPIPFRLKTRDGLCAELEPIVV